MSGVGECLWSNFGQWNIHPPAEISGPDVFRQSFTVNLVSLMCGRFDEHFASRGHPEIGLTILTQHASICGKVSSRERRIAGPLEAQAYIQAKQMR